MITNNNDIYCSVVYYYFLNKIEVLYKLKMKKQKSKFREMTKIQHFVFMFILLSEALIKKQQMIHSCRCLILLLKSLFFSFF